MAAGSLKPAGRVLAEAGGRHALDLTGATLAGYRTCLTHAGYLRALGNSALISGAVVALGLLVNGAAGYALARLAWPGRRLLLGLVVAVMVVPFEAIAVPLFYAAARLGLRDTYLVQILPFVADAFSIYLFYSFFRGLPRELEEAAYVDGASTLRCLVEVVAPASAPAAATVAVLTLLGRWGSYLWPLLVTSGPRVRPLPVALATLYTLPPRDWGAILAFGVLSAAPPLLLFLLFQRAFLRGAAAAGGQ
ncbi:MAG: carbohydrate ABC transporter permease [Nitrospirae bacterium]|nr:MAG: carbohydrate ABC transporter permease [Nitrospirota bacterium]